ncbi:MAG: extracellular solute-binding protein [Campylobacteraceae bacterium]|nr:extracellular solute-binding protein [Campylobacteraceae bacterium]
MIKFYLSNNTFIFKIIIFVFLINVDYITNLNAQDKYLNIVSARQEYLMKPIFDQFTKDTGIKVNYIIMDASEATEMIKSQANDTQVDALLAVDASDLYEAQQMGIFQTIRSRILNKNIPSHLKDPSLQWFGLSLRVRSIVYNTNTVNPDDLSDYESIGDKKWLNKLIVRTSERIYNKSMVAMMIAHYGYDKTKIIIRSWVQNFAMKPLTSDVDVITEIIKGNGDIGIVNSYYLAKMIKDDPSLNVKMLWLGDEQNRVHVNISGIGITRYAKRKKEAIKLIEWLSSKKGQKLFADLDMEFPVNKRVKAHKILQEWGLFKQIRINVRKAGELRSQAVKLMKEVKYE